MYKTKSPASIYTAEYETSKEQGRVGRRVVDFGTYTRLGLSAIP